jgi:formylglycine-generating enzyme required for sulfatase activity
MEREYPWEGKWDDRLANTIEAGLGETTSVGMYPGGAAACGALDMSGNVWEWCLNNFNFKGNKGLRGGSYHIDASYARCAARADLPRYRGDDNLGFRVVVAPLT